jgi:hypothetical protein
MSNSNAEREANSSPGFARKPWGFNADDSRGATLKGLRTSSVQMANQLL